MKITIEELRKIAKSSPLLAMENQVGQWEDGTWYSSWKIGGGTNAKGERNIVIRTGDGGALEYYNMITNMFSDEKYITELIKNATSN